MPRKVEIEVDAVLQHECLPNEKAVVASQCTIRGICARAPTSLIPALEDTSLLAREAGSYVGNVTSNAIVHSQAAATLRLSRAAATPYNPRVLCASLFKS